ncbi:4Fe-4S ferredoxin [Moorella thermoacetica]|uniref:Electron transport complex subunit RsxB n=2 Tax=Neomoorella thermoacetica TaxID=1525 RepID=A0AAC9HJG2_NEOTH|nr:4Fe-4S dicluster-binding protein [Moorella thermoacetica]AKX94708.1 ferredoxin-1 [Moorella thermoacetica]AKX97340.1 ferredoxin-1 [Moorella thermoacetica]AOQ24851.1 Ferredoxin-1 [Moorella thermoacetica]OIQ57241.1 ferredoxin-1 [Moorella thermoacetica]QDA01168.1 Ferredoxin-1 [Moorella thermoacetica]
MKRKIVHIDDEKCTGCGLCVTPCAEGAIEIVNGKARVLREELCDGAGVCLNVCPTGALTIEEREAPAFDPAAAAANLAAKRNKGEAPRCVRCGAGEGEAVLLFARHRGESTWVCTRCLPVLIHG